MRSVKSLLIAGEIAAILSAIMLVWAVCLEEVERDAVTATFITIFVVSAIVLQSMQQEIK